MRKECIRGSRKGPTNTQISIFPEVAKNQAPMIQHWNSQIRLAGVLLVSFCVASSGIAQEEETPSRRPRAEAGVDPQARQLFDKGVELLEYKQHERGLAMLNTVVRDYQGTIMAHKAHMAMGKHHLEQRATAEALSHFMLLTRVLAPVPGETKSDALKGLYMSHCFRQGFPSIRLASMRPAFLCSAGSPKWRRRPNGRIRLISTSG